MTQLKHTPGPWIARFPDDNRAPVEIRSEHPVVEGAAEGVEVAVIRGRLGHRGDAPCGCYRDNARLIAASPELLEALKELTGRVEGLLGPIHGEHYSELYAELWRKVGHELRRAQDAISKAIGGNI